MRILIVEDEDKVAQSIGRALEANGFVPEYAQDGEDAWFKGSTEPYTAAVLDIGLPLLDGLSVLRKWRREGVTIPVILLTAKGSWPERVDGIDAGADDYMVKPFQMEELIARLWGLIRRSSGNLSPIIERGELSIDTRQMRVSESGVPVNLTPLEFRLLSFLLHNEDKVISQEELASNIYFQDQEPGSNAIEVMVGRLRKKFKTRVVETRRGFGYCMGPGTL
ncbi:response regulator transcription factor [uncultured Shimia sp.]|uniref:response regulator transcription factor n=1 Tax=uncultured Shimia sp. TaxID=573152 RepID=UPI00260BAF8C|nr:response regulator transcription factor [uncultured Shimia sp.]